MIDFPNIFLPEEFCQLLKKNIQDHRKMNSFIYNLIHSSLNLKMVVKKAFQHLDPHKSIDSIVRSLGRNNFRDRLGQVYLHYAKYSHFPDKSETTMVQDVLSLESKISFLLTEGNSRAFMFFYYLKLAEISFPSEVFTYLSNMKSKTHKIDWLIIVLWHFHIFIGGSQLTSCLQNGKMNYLQVYSQLPSENQKKLVSNLLTYAYAINEKELFFDDIV